MNKEFCDPRELLSALIEVDTKLNITINEYSKNSDVMQSKDIDQILEEFIEDQNNKYTDNKSLLSELALLCLRREVQKTIDVVVDSNSLRAHYDFEKQFNNSIKTDAAEIRKWRLREIFFGAMIGVIITTLVLWYWFPPGL